jgi:hypothetical protein
MIHHIYLMGTTCLFSCQTVNGSLLIHLNTRHLKYFIYGAEYEHICRANLMQTLALPFSILYISALAMLVMTKNGIYSVSARCEPVSYGKQQITQLIGHNWTRK